MSTGPRIVVVGGGLVALATAWKLTSAIPTATLVVLEKESGVGAHQSSHNSGVLHCGLYYQPGSLKAFLAVNGIREMTRFAREHDIPHEICGKVVVATDQAEIARLKELERRGTLNGLRGLKWLEADELRDREPSAAGLAALLVPEEGIISFATVAKTLADLLVASGHEVHVNSEVIRWTQVRGRQIVGTRNGEWDADFAINCAGLHSDRVFALTGERRPCRIVPFRGEYYALKSHAERLVRHLIYPVPDPAFPFLGVHFTRIISGGVEAGPSAMLALKREGYSKMSFNARDAFDALSFPGLARFLGRYPRFALTEIRRAVSKRVFCESLQRLVPALTEADIEPGPSGVRAQAMTPRGDLVMDFLIEERSQQLHVLNAPSPGATASLAIGGLLADKVQRHFS